MADPAVVDPYLDIFRLEFSRVIFIEFEFAARLFGGIAFYYRHCASLNVVLN